MAAGEYDVSCSYTLADAATVQRARESHRVHVFAGAMACDCATLVVPCRHKCAVFKFIAEELRCLGGCRPVETAAGAGIVPVTSCTCPPTGGYKVTPVRLDILERQVQQCVRVHGRHSDRQMHPSSYSDRDDDSRGFGGAQLPTDAVTEGSPVTDTSAVNSVAPSTVCAVQHLASFLAANPIESLQAVKAPGSRQDKVIVPREVMAAVNILGKSFITAEKYVKLQKALSPAVGALIGKVVWPHSPSFGPFQISLWNSGVPAVNAASSPPPHRLPQRVPDIRVVLDDPLFLRIRGDAVAGHGAAQLGTAVGRSDGECG